jgi:hypothetical protein
MAKGRTTQKGYGWRHQQERARAKRVVDAGKAHCARCGGYILPGEPFDLDHTLDRTGYLGPSHRRCNRGEPNKRRRGKHNATAASRVQSRLRWTRVWAEPVPDDVELCGNDAASVALRRKRGY